MKYEVAHTELIDKLRHQLEEHITYHDVDHTLYVIHAASYLAEQENIIGEDLILLKTAALYHDAGFLVSHIEHEEKSCEIAKIELEEYGYNAEQIERICEMIMATRLPQEPKNHLSELLCDADLFYLGGDNYEEYADKLFREFKANNIIQSESEWIEMQNNFLSNHRYFTVTAQKEQGPKRNQNLLKIRALAEGNN